MKAIGILMAGCMVAGGVWAAEVTGSWTAEMPGRGGITAPVTLNLEADGDTLTGTITGPEGEAEISDGIIDDDTISFEVIRVFDGNQITERFEGVVNDDIIRFSVTTDGGRRGGGAARHFEAHRAD